MAKQKKKKRRMKLPSRPRSNKNKTTSCADLVLKQAKKGQGHLDEKLRL